MRKAHWAVITLAALLAATVVSQAGIGAGRLATSGWTAGVFWVTDRTGNDK